MSLGRAGREAGRGEEREWGAREAGKGSAGGGENSSCSLKSGTCLGMRDNSGM